MSPLLLAPLFDYAKSFDFSYYQAKAGFLSNYFGHFFFPSKEFSQILYEYSENVDVVKTFINLDINKFFRDFEENGPIKFNKELFDAYVNFCERKQDILSRCLK